MRMLKANPPRLLVKMHPEAGMQLAARPFQLEGNAFRMRVLCPNEDMGPRLGAASPARWFLAEANPAAATAGELRELAHRAVAARGLGAGAGDVYMEPDLAQTWLYQNPTRVSGGLGAAPGETCAFNDQAVDFPKGPGFAWHLGDDFSQLKRARDAVAAANPTAVRIGILDVGFDFGHKAKPENLRLDLQKNFVDDGQASNDASDPFARGLLKNPGHGTGTLGILAGGRLNGMLEPGQNTGDFLGGAPARGDYPCSDCDLRDSAPNQRVRGSTRLSARAER